MQKEDQEQHARSRIDFDDPPTDRQAQPSRRRALLLFDLAATGRVR